MTPGIVVDVKQGSDRWAEARCGLVTASRAADVIAMTKKGEEKAERRNYRTELICERLTGIPYPRYVTKEMQWGIDQEPFARAAYELHAGVLVETSGFVLHPEITAYGASPDGLVGEDGLLQIKCPATSKHIDSVRAGMVPVEHMPQMLAEMSCTGRSWCDFVSFDPRLPEHLQLFVKRFERDEKWIQMLEAEVIHFNAEIEQVLRSLPQNAQPIAKVLAFPAEDEVEF